MSDLQRQASDSSGDSNDGNDSIGSSFRARLRNAWSLEFEHLRWRLLVFPLLARLFPANRAARLRTALIRAIGVNIGPGTRFLGTPKIQCVHPGPLRSRLSIGRDCTIHGGVILECGDTLTIGDRAEIGDGAVFLTTSHQLGPKEHRAGALVRNPVAIGNDVAIEADAIILPGVTVGDGARVLSKSVVNANVAAGVTVSGIPARPLRPT